MNYQPILYLKTELVVIDATRVPSINTQLVFHELLRNSTIQAVPTAMVSLYLLELTTYCRLL